MITFTDAHEAELWRAVAAGQIVTLSTVQPTLSPADVAAHAGLFADAAVLEYRKRCGQERLQALLGERPESLAIGVHALISKFANQRLDMLIGATAEARRNGAEQQRSAIVAVLRDEYDDSIANDFEAGMWDDRLTGEGAP